MNFVKDNSATFIERKLSFEKKKPMQILVSLSKCITITYLPCPVHSILFPMIYPILIYHHLCIYFITHFYSFIISPTKHSFLTCFVLLYHQST